MPLTRLDIQGVRNLERVSLRELGRINLFVGVNGSGKTSLLEAVYLLGMARSFRTAQVRKVITHEADSFTVYGEVESSVGLKRRVGITRDRAGDLDARIDGCQVSSRSMLVETLPLQLIDAESLSILTGGPRERRQFLDWGVFHVEHAFYEAWQRFQKAIRQRNALLRRGKIDDCLMAPWEQELAEAGARIHAARSRYIEWLRPAFQSVLQRIAPDLLEMDLGYRGGWDGSLGLQEALAKSRATDLQQGFTQIGPQRAEVKILCGGRAAADVLSRGQQKLVACALKLAQGSTLEEKRGQGCVYLVDDLAAELDQIHYRSVAAVLQTINSQVFVTSIEQASAMETWSQSGHTERRVFHVEHGSIQPASWAGDRPQASEK